MMTNWIVKSFLSEIMQIISAIIGCGLASTPKFGLVWRFFRQSIFVWYTLCIYHFGTRQYHISFIKMFAAIVARITIYFIHVNLLCITNHISFDSVVNIVLIVNPFQSVIPLTTIIQRRLNSLHINHWHRLNSIWKATRSSPVEKNTLIIEEFFAQ